ncbi:non-ribosomal peptide synthetase [Pseudoalteromonas luteoviolacea]|uniref:non-ribosomal peptide synthetase n=1 Tax=Pseudoalteromonas luteoviolacea TaxID=43657 RepID=UPI000B32B4C2|nr:non-ribosomal peptide synthetase [Pseudoalteromonas luteoviolacea]
MQKNIEQILGLTSVQKGMLIESIKSEGNSVYSAQLRLSLAGNLSVDSLHEAVNQLVKTHQTLRSVFRWERIKEPVQIVLKEVKALFNFVDLSGESNEEKINKTREIIEKDRDTPFDIRKACIRFLVIKVEENRYELIVCNHHIILDGWSNALLLESLFDLYCSTTGNSNRAKKSWNVTSLEQHRKHELIASKNTQKSNYWQREVSDFIEENRLSIRELKTDFQVGYTSQSSPLNKNKIDKIAEQFQITPSTVLLGCWGLLLRCYNNSDDICFGTAISNRATLPENLATVITMGIQTVPLRFNIASTESLAYYFERVQSSVNNALVNQPVDLNEIMRSSGVSAESELFDTLFTVENYPLNESVILNSTGLELIDAEHWEMNHYPMSVTAQLFAQYKLDLNYDRSQFNDELITLLLNQFSFIIDRIYTKPNSQLKEISLLDRDIRLDVINQVNPRYKEPTWEASVIELFESAAASFSEYIAIEQDDRVITYQQLNNYANQIAQQIVSSPSYAPQKSVLVYLPNSITLIATMIACWKADVVYVPVDAVSPPSRAGQIALECRAIIAISDRSLDLTADIDFWPISAISHDMNKAFLAPKRSASPDNLLYILFTSGSTGKPKGVMIDHRACLSFCNAFGEVANLQPQDRVLSLTGIAFDVYFGETLVPLLAGATIQLADKQQTIQGEGVAGLLNAQDFAMLQATPSRLSMILLQARSEFSQAKLQKLMLAGEALPTEIAKQAQRYFGEQCQIVNLYGPTEASVYATWQEFNSAHPVNIGHGMANVKAFVVDRNGHVQPPFVRGEIALAGQALARGYLNLPEKTAQSFVSGEFLNEDRIYLTGDIARVIENGEIDILGRRDEQIKLRGYRIELGEVEQSLQALIDVKAALVRVHETAQGVQQLVAYVVTDNSGTTQLESKVRAELSKQLPDYMVPNVFFFLEKWPLNTSGKIDKKALPTPDQAEHSAPYIAPATFLEHEVQKSFATVLGVEQEQVSISDNFFEIGGHSLAAMKVAADISKRLDVDVSLQYIFMYSSVAQLAQQIHDLPSYQKALAIPAKEESAPLKPSFSQQRIWFVDRLMGSTQYNMPIAFEIDGSFDIDAAQFALYQVIMQHPVLRTTLLEKNGEIAPVVLEPKSFDITKYGIESALNNEQIERLIIEHSTKAFDLSSDLMLRASYLKGQYNRQVFVLVVHHIAFDGWSEAILLSTFSRYYEAFISGDTSTGSLSGIQFSDYAYWQQTTWRNSSEYQSQLTYWQHQLDSLPDTHSLPLDYKRPQTKQTVGKSISVGLHEAQLKALCDYAQAHSLTPFMLFQGVFALFVAIQSKSKEVAIGTVVANREQKELHDIIGFFANTLVLKSSLEQPSFSKYLKHIKEVNLQAQANQAAPFEQVVDSSHASRDPAYTPLFQILFLMEQSSTQTIGLGDACLNSLPANNRISKFDLEVTLRLGEDKTEIEWLYDCALFSDARIEQYTNDFITLLNSVIDGSLTESWDKISQFESIELSRAATVTPSQYIAPKNQLQHALVTIWADVLGVPSNTLGIDDNFFNLGGHSLLAIKLLSEIQDRLNMALDMSEFYSSPTIRECADSLKTNDINDDLVLLTRGGEAQSYPVSFAQQRLWFLHKMRPDSTEYNMSVSIDVKGNFRLPAAQKAMLDVIQKHEILRSIYQQDKEQLVQHIQEVEQYIFDFVDLGSHVHNQKQQALGEITAEFFARSFDLTRDLMVQSCYVSLGEAQGVLLFNVHHIAADGHSIGIFLQEFSDNYSAYAQDKAPQIMPLSVQYIDYANWQLKWLESEQYSRQEAHWQSTLKNVPSVHRLPLDFVRHIDNPSISQSFTVENSSSVHERLVAKSSEFGVTPFMWSHAVFSLALMELSKSNDIVIGTPVSGRKLNALNDQIGLFVNTLPLRVKCNESQTFSEFLNVIKGVNANALSNQDLPFERLLDLCNVSRSSQYTPLFQILFTMNEVSLSNLELWELEVEPVLPIEQTAKFDLSLDISSDDKCMYWKWVYDGSIFASDTIEKLARRANELLQQTLTKADTDLNLLIRDFDQLSSHIDMADEGEEFVAARSDEESALVQLWANILGRKESEISVRDNFFALGGNSLQSVQLVSELYKAYGKEISIAAFYDEPTIECCLSLMANQEQVSQAHKIEKSDLPATPSYAQQRMWFLSQVTSEPLYNMASEFNVTGPFDTASATSALNKLVQRHEVLRSQFLKTEHGLEVAILDSFKPEVTEYNLIGLEPEDQKNQLEALITANKTFNFQLDSAPLFRCDFCRISSEQGVLLFNIHHIISDGLSVDNMFEEFITHYESLINNDTSSLSSLPLQYSDYVEWQKKWMGEARAEQQLAYWYDQLANIPAVHGLSLDFPRPEVKLYQADLHTVTLPISVKRRLTSLSERFKVTEFVFLHSVLSYVLARHSNSQEILIGTPVAGRRHPDLASLIGLFVNTVALRTTLSGCRTFSEYLSHVKAVNGEAQDNQDIPFEQVVEHCQIERSVDYTPVYQIMMTMRGENQSKQVADVYFEQQEVFDGVAKFDLSVDVVLDERGVTWNWAFDSQLFTHQHIAQVSEHVIAVLEQVLEEPAVKLCDVAMLNAKELQQLSDWGKPTNMTLSHQDTIQARFRKQAQSFPHSVAIRTGESHLTYQQLDILSDKLAGDICQLVNGQRDIRISEGTLIALYQSRSIEFIVSILAITKAGGAYVPITIDTPAQRVTQLLHDSQTSLVLTQLQFSEQLDSLLNASAVTVNAEVLVVDIEALYQAPNSTVTSFEAQQTDLVYVNYTSGTTGLPKGVMIEQTGVLRLIDQPFLAMNEETVTIQISSLAFDAATFEIWGALLNGGCCVLYTHPHMDLALFNQILGQHAVTHTFITAGLFRRWASSLNESEQGYNLQVVLSGGDIVSPQSVRQVQEALPNAQVFNCYGPTENTTFTTYFAVPALSQKAEKPLPIGVPMQGDSVYIVSEDLKLQPPGVIGELLVGGGLARGYLNQPELSEEKFVHVETANGQVERLYRTGDLVRFNAKGLVEFIGRDDQQLKIRGFRVELAEISAGIEQSQQVSQVYVVAQRAENMEPKLIAYVVPEIDDVSNLASQLEILNDGGATYYKMNDAAQRWLQVLKQEVLSALPAYMAPHCYVMLPELPITKNGKVDSKLLPAAQELQLDVEFQSPNTELERDVARLWAQVLKIDAQSIGRHTGFFELGGHSLSMISLSALIQAQLNVEISISDLYAHAELSAMAALLSSSRDGQWREIEVVKSEQGQYALSPAQQRLWFIDKLGEFGGAYNIPVAFEVFGDLQLDLVNSAIDILLTMHPVLRSVYKETAQGVIQQVIPMSDVHCVVEHIKVDASADFYDELANIAIKPFDLSTDIMLRVYYVSLPNDNSGRARGCLILNMHHIAVDGWSVALLTEQFSHCYELLNQGQSASMICNQLAKNSVSYGDYATWLNAPEQQNQVAEQVEYWRSQLADAPCVHGLPLLRHRPEIKQTDGARIVSTVSPEQTVRLRSVAQNNDMTMFMLVHAMVSLLIARHGGSNDVVVGTPTANRRHEQTKDLVGLFVNTLVLRVNAGHHSLRDFLQHVKKVNIEAQSHQDVPFEQLVDALNVSRNPGVSPIFQIMLDMNTNEQAGIHLNDVELSSLNEFAFPVQSKFDIHISVVPNDRKLDIHWVYDTALFDSTYIEQLDSHLHNLFASVCMNNSDDITSLDMLSSTEVEYLTQQMNPSSDISVPVCLHRLFEEQATKTPHAVAVCSGSHTLTYEELNAQAESIAAYLVSQNTAVGDVVGICMSRSEKTLAVILAVLKVGAAYVPLDPNYPKARIEYILADAKPVQVFIDSSTAHCFEFGNVNVVNIEQIPQLSKRSSSEVFSDVNQMAYIIYTSGSTGNPKGVMISHRNAAAMLAWANEYFSDEEKRRVLASTSLNFDLSIFEIFLPLVSGGTCVVVDSILSLLEADHCALDVTLINTVPSGINSLLQEGRIPASAITVNLAGEPLQANTVNRLLDLATIDRVVNLYGPSEDTTYSTFYSMAQPVDSNPLIGKPISSTQALILDSNQQLVPFGCIGELYLSGEGVSMGYLNQPNLTANSYLDNPYISGSKMYKTGDLVKYTKAGYLDYLGRIDDQVKVNGFRIELGEIEFHLLRLEFVEACLVKVAQEPTRTLLIAYIEVSSLSDNCEQQVREHLSKNLPKHMVPNVIVTLDTWPLLPNGKIDKKNLPAWNISRVTVEPQTPTEIVVAEIWHSLLGINGEVLDAEQSFFSLGGNSLLAVKLNGLIQKRFGISIGLAQLFELQSIKQQSQAIDKALSVGRTSYDIVPLQHQKARPLAPAQRRLWFLSQLNEQSTEYNMCTAYEYQSAIDPDVLKLSIEALIARHEPLQATYHMVDLQPMWSLNETDNLMFNEVDLSGLPISSQKAQWRDILKSEFEYVFDLSKGPLVRVSLIKTGPQCGKLIFNIHHIGFDGWSMHIVERELQTIYGALLASKVPQLPLLPVTYSDYVSWRNEFEQTQAYESQVEYWLEHLADAPPLHRLPIQFERPEVKRNDAVVLSTVLDNEQKSGLAALCASLQVTQFMLVHALISLLIARHSNDHDVILLTPIANREQQSITDLVGFFTNTLVLRSNTEFNSFVEFIAHIKECNIAAQRNQLVPFEYLVEQLNLPRSTAFTPLAQLMLNFIEASEPTCDGAMSLQRVEQGESAKFDLEIRVENRASEWGIDWIYDKALFSSEYISKLSSDFIQLVDNLLALNGEVNALSLTQLSLYDEKMQAELQLGVKGEKQLYTHSSIHALVEHNAIELADHPALQSANGDTVSYQTLNQLANRISHSLIELGVNQFDVIAMSLPRGVEQIALLLGILKAGATYLPIDTQLPAARMEHIIGTSSARLWVVEDDQPITAVDSFISSRFVSIAELVANENRDNPNIEVAPSDPAYLLFTSGTTGLPKGVLQTHQTIANLVQTGDHDQPYTGLQFTPITFDVSIQELATAWHSGACLVLMTEHQKQELADIRGLIEAHQVQRLFVPPAVFDLIAQQYIEHPNTKVSLKEVIVAGEQLILSEAIRTFLACNPQCQLWNHYGPTETHVVTTYKIGTGSDTAPPIGCLIPNVDAYVVGIHQQLMPVGSKGELWIAGCSLAREYIGNELQNSEKFIALGESERCYNTGDVVLFDGYDFKYYGRSDRQVQIRGFRVELADIESHLRQQAGVIHAHVIQRNESGKDMLVSYIEYDHAQTTKEDVIAEAKQHLPDYMHPDAWVEVSHWPLNTNGKLNVHALPIPKLELETHIAPSTEVEQTLVNMWADLLGLSSEQVSIDSNFFEVGGHSLLVVKLVAQIRAEFQVELNVRDIFSNPRVREQAEIIDLSHAKKAAIEAVAKSDNVIEMEI